MLGMLDNMLSINKDAFSSGQISSKIWLCNELEKISMQRMPLIYVYGGWYGVLSFLLLTRNKFPIKKIRSIDIDPNCETIADALLENWVWKNWKFKALTADCNNIDFKIYERPDIIINCSSEHFKTKKWFEDIPSGVMVIIQSNNMDHDDHHSCYESLAEFLADYPMDQTLYKGELPFNYPGWDFSRYMLIGYKK